MISMPAGNIQRFFQLVEFMIGQTLVSKNLVQTLVGKIVHILACVPAARTFVNRILQALRDAHAEQFMSIDEGTVQDLMWFKQFLKKFNAHAAFNPKVHY